MGRLVFPLLVVAFIAGLLLAALEVGLRATGFSRPVWYQPDPQLGWTLRPETRGWYTEEGRGYVWVNPAGLRDRSHDTMKPKGVYRVAVLGGAYAEAMPLSFNDTFWWRLEGALQQCPGQSMQIEVMNFGVSGYSTAQDEAMLERVASQYRPDLVLLAFSGAEDLPRNSPRLAGAKRGPFEGRQPAAWERYAWLAADRLRSAQLATVAWHRYEDWRDESGAQAAGAQAAPGAELAALAPPRDAAWRDAWDRTEREIAGMNRFSAAHHARFAVAVVTQPEQVDPDAAARKRLQAQLGVPDLFYPEQRIGALGRREGFQVVTFAAELQRRADAQKTFFHGFRNGGIGKGHWNAAGHQAAAEILARELCPGGLSGAPVQD